MKKIITDCRTMNSLIRQGAVTHIREADKYYRGMYVDSVKPGVYWVGRNRLRISEKYLSGCFKPYVLAETCNWEEYKDRYTWLDRKDVKVPTYIYQNYYNLYTVGIGNPDDKNTYPVNFDSYGYAKQMALALGNGKKLDSHYNLDGTSTLVEVEDSYWMDRYNELEAVPSMTLGIFRK